MIRSPWRNGSVSLPRATQDNITPKIGAKVYETRPPYITPAIVRAVTYTLHAKNEYLVPKFYEKNPHFPAASGRAERLGSGSCNFRGVLDDRFSKNIWEENIL